MEPKEQIRDDQASIDIRLGFEFAFVDPSAHASVDEFLPNDGHAPPLSQFFRRRYVALGHHVVIHPHQFVLASTLEYLRLPHDLMAYVIGRSTWGRLGLIVATAVGIQPSFAGVLTLELKNLGEVPISLYPGQAIAQLFFHKIDAKRVEGSGLGQYSGSIDILPRRLSSPITHKKLAALRKKPSGP
ncbi:MAG: dCTP deaminase [Tagaea sp.]|nr:dCTP deaminase [Tagaea sp.]